MDFREPDEAGIGQRHRLIAIAVHEGSEGGLLFLNGKSDSDYAALQQGEECVCLAAFAFEEERGLGKHGLAGEERRSEELPLTDRPIVLLEAGS